MDAPTLIDCDDCHFREVVAPDDDVLPGEVLVDHGRETGHRLEIVPEADAAADGSPTDDSGTGPPSG